MSNAEVLAQLGFSASTENPFYLTFDPSRPEPSEQLFAIADRAALAEPYRAYREAVREALEEVERPPQRLGLSFNKKALGHLAQLLTRLPEEDSLKELGRFLLRWSEEGFDAFPDETLEHDYGRSLNDSASLWFDDLMGELKRQGFELTEYSVEPFGYRNYLKGRVSGTFSKRALAEIEEVLPDPVAAAASELYYEAARYAAAKGLLEEAYEPSVTRDLMGLLKKAGHARYRTLLLFLVTGDLDGFADATGELNAADLAEAIDADWLEKAEAAFHVEFNDRDGDDPLRDVADSLQRALRDWYERELEGSFADRLDWLARAIEHALAKAQPVQDPTLEQMKARLRGFGILEEESEDAAA
ncbi:hypothetical protein Ocepr_2284 (plasmid) [Oceanithermus profundus DSM 14977]|uniref:Uncharacterized protein n=1 Tax=Oceanithermus profundus (strain DSM 14977 / NBRC 100410 / VKM B-2274 / 506) TaxID=670487 RepID=E4UAU7_OCEP5|nr:hypothetical protein [Oceanithermus profundus]ADR37732.1 hypothetical protein Ocepr_2284 [Oceanithermus profundus DSM 14977]